MNKKVYMIIATVIVCLSVVLAAIYVMNNNSYGTRVVTDSEGYEVIFEEKPETAISLIASATETIYDLEMGDVLIAVDTYSNYPEATNDLEKIDTMTGLNVESLIAKNPDVIFMSKMGQTVEQYESLTNAGIEVVIVDATSIEETYDAIEIIGEVLGADKKADETVSYMKEEIEKLKEECKDLETKTLYYEISPLQYGLWTSGNGTFENDIMEILNITNVFNDASSWASVSEEQVIAKNPEYIVTTSTDYPGFNAVEEIQGRENWQDITAIKDGNIYQINADTMSRPCKRLIDGMKELKKIVYGN